MELFIPSVLLLLLAAAVIFFILPRFGAAALAMISVALLVYGIYQHMNAFGTEYRLSTWQLSLASYAPYIMVGGLLVVIAFYLLSISSLGRATNSTAPVINMPEMPTIENMPTPNTATNMVTAGVNNALKGVANAAAAVGLANGNGTKAANANKGVGAPIAAVANGALAVANQAKNAVANVAANVSNAMKNMTGAITGSANGVKNNKGLKVPGLNFPISQA